MKSSYVGSLLGKLLKKRYPTLRPDIQNVTITFDDLLHWPLWPNFIKLYGKVHLLNSLYKSRLEHIYSLLVYYKNLI